MTSQRSIPLLVPGPTSPVPAPRTALLHLPPGIPGEHLPRFPTLRLLAFIVVVALTAYAVSERAGVLTTGDEPGAAPAAAGEVRVPRGGYGFQDGGSYLPEATRADWTVTTEVRHPDR